MKNKIINSIHHYLEKPSRFFIRFFLTKIPMSDKKYLKKWYRLKYGEKLNLDNPQTYNEKLQWLKLYDRRPIYTKMVDKYAVKELVAEMIGSKYVIPLLGVWSTPKEIDFNALPQQFVLKVTHGGGSGGVVICKDKVTLNKEFVIKKLTKCMKYDGYAGNKEWPYKDVCRRIIAEEYMEDNMTKELRDYKFFCFDGEPKVLFIASGRGKQKEPNFDWFDMDFNHLELKTEHPTSDIQHLPQKPYCFEEMKIIAAKLSQGIPQVRIDLYEVNKRVYFGEFTFFHWSGVNRFDPEEWNLKMGEWINLDKIKKGN